MGQTRPTPSATSTLATLSPSPSPLPTARSDWRTVTDSKTGFVFGYPPSWTDVSQAVGATAGSHYVASRPTLANLRDIGPSDWWLVVWAYSPDSSIGCGEPLNPLQSGATQLDGQPAKQFVRQGTPIDPNQWIVEAIALRAQTCYHLQMVTGRTVTRADAVAMFQAIEATFRFGA
jgi:hypothetical protein